MSGNQPKDGGPAFPGIAQISTRDDIHEGMSLRDYFAAQAINAVSMTMSDEGDKFLACRCYQIADAMLAWRAKGGGA